MDSFLNTSLGGDGSLAKRSRSSSIWWLLFIGVVAFGAFMLFGRKKPASAGGPQQGGYGRQPAAINTYGRAGATNMMNQIMHERSGFQQPEPYYCENETGEETGPKGAMVHFANPIASQMNSQQQGEMEPMSHQPSIAAVGGTAADQLAGMPSLARTDVRGIDFNALRSQFGKGKNKGG